MFSSGILVIVFRDQLHCAWNPACHQKNLVRVSVKAKQLMEERGIRQMVRTK